MTLKRSLPAQLVAKTHFVIVDAIGVCKSLKTDSRPLERKPTVPLKNLMLNVVMGNRDEDTVTSLANRLARLNNQLTDKEKKKFTEQAGGKPITDVIHELFDAYNPDKNVERVKNKFKLKPGAEPTDEQIKIIQHEMAAAATKVFDKPTLRDFIEHARQEHEQIIDVVNIDKILNTGFDKQAKEKAETLIAEFNKFIEENRDAITALRLYYGQPYRRRELTFQMINELCETIKQKRPNLAPFAVWRAYEQLETVGGTRPENELVALVSLVRRVMDIDKTLTPYDATVNRNFQTWVMGKHRGNAPKFTEEQMQWLRMIKDHIATSMHMRRDDFDYNPFAELGGLGKAWAIFGDKLDALLEEMNENLAA